MIYPTRIAILLILTGFLTPDTSFGQETYSLPDKPVELGMVHWHRNYNEAIDLSQTTGLPVLILFQEVPGCANCTRYGRQVLSHPLIVEIIEDHFIPLAIFNNKGGADARVLRQFNEPAWNNPVVRIVNEKGMDLTKRLNSDFSVKGLLSRMHQGLSLSGQTIPDYLQLLLTEVSAQDRQKEAYLGMYCFWTGEKVLGQIPGIISTEAGFMMGGEVVKIQYDASATNLTQIAAIAKEKGCADRIYSNDEVPEGFKAGKPGRYRVDKEDKYYLYHSEFKSVPMTPHQATKVNAALGNREVPDKFLSPRQLSFIQNKKQHGSKDYQPSRILWERLDN